MPTSPNLLAAVEGAEEEINPLIPALYDIVWSAVVFVVILLLFWKYVLPRLRELEAQRIAGIEAKLEKAEADRAEAQALLEQYRAQLAEARNEAARIRTEAQSERKSIVDAARVEAQETAAAVTERSQAHQQAELVQARAQLSREVGALAVQLAERILGERLADEAQTRASVDRFLTELETTSAADGASPATRSSDAAVPDATGQR